MTKLLLSPKKYMQQDKHLSIVIIKVRRSDLRGHFPPSVVMIKPKYSNGLACPLLKTPFLHLLLNPESSEDVDGQVTWCQIPFRFSGSWLILFMLILWHCIMFVAFQRMHVMTMKGVTHLESSSGTVSNTADTFIPCLKTRLTLKVTTRVSSSLACWYTCETILGLSFCPRLSCLDPKIRRLAFSILFLCLLQVLYVYFNLAPYLLIKVCCLCFLLSVSLGLPFLFILSKFSVFKEEVQI